MRYQKDLLIEFPADEDGMVGRECPRCTGRFTIQTEEFEERGFLNLRCPYCEFISKAEQFQTGEQRAYAYSTQQNELRRIAEQVIEEQLDQMFSSSGLDIERTEPVEFGTVPIESPQFSTQTELHTCSQCKFPYGIEPGQTGCCPVCR